MPDITSSYVALGSLVVAALSWVAVAHRWRARMSLARVPSVAPALSEYPLVSILLPARNEASVVEACVRSLLAQDYPHVEVIAIDDCSEDGTGAILHRLAAGEPRLTVIDGVPLPPGWMGKAHAIAQGYHAARGQWLLFTDADTHHAPWLLSGVMARLEQSSAAFVTVFGRQRHVTRGVQLVNLAVFTGVWWFLADERGFRDPDSPSSLVNGQYVMFDREAYESIGTHAAVRRYSSTDMSLGYLAKRQGWKPLRLSAIDGLTTVMYRTAADAWHGWSRSLVNVAWTRLGRARGSLALLGAVAAMLLFWLAPWILLWHAAATGTRLSLAVAGAQLGAGLAAMRQLTDWRGAIRATAVMPASCLILAALSVAGLLHAWRSGATLWKGRLVRTTARLPPWNPLPARDRHSGPPPSRPAAEPAGRDRLTLRDRQAAAPPE